MDIIPYQTKSKKIAGTNLREVAGTVRAVFREIEKQTKKSPMSVALILKKRRYFSIIFRTILIKNLHGKNSNV